MVKRSTILAHFRSRDPRLAEIFSSVTLEELRPKNPAVFFPELVSAIIGQQLSGTVADSIEARFTRLFPEHTVSAEGVARLNADVMRSAGLSGAKVRYIQDLSKNVRTGAIDLNGMSGLPDREIIRLLTNVHGIGPWTAEMFLIFTLARPDVFSFGDLGLRRGIQAVYGLKKEPAVGFMKRISGKWSPYRSYAARTLWNYLDNRE